MLPMLPHCNSSGNAKNVIFMGILPMLPMLPLILIN